MIWARICAVGLHTRNIQFIILIIIVITVYSPPQKMFINNKAQYSSLISILI